MKTTHTIESLRTILSRSTLDYCLEVKAKLPQAGSSLVTQPFPDNVEDATEWILRWFAPRFVSAAIDAVNEKQPKEEPKEGPKEEPKQEVAAKAKTKAEPKPEVAVPDPAAISKAAQLLSLISSFGGVDPEAVGKIVEAKFAAEEQAMIGRIAKKTIRTIVVQRANVPAVNVGIQHKCFPHLVRAVEARLPNGRRLNPWLWGPAGTGKTTAARAIADALKIPFYFSGAISTPFQLLGYTDAHGRLVRTPFRDAWENGGVFLLDEIDASEAIALNALNTAIDGGECAFPDKMIKRHDDLVLIAGANTVGRGGTAEYNGRLKIDDAALDRWYPIEWPHDDVLEEAIAGSDDSGKRALQIVRVFRAAMLEEKVKGGFISTRATLTMAALLRVGTAEDIAADGAIRKGMPLESWNRIVQRARNAACSLAKGKEV